METVVWFYLVVLAGRYDEVWWESSLWSDAGHPWEQDPGQACPHQIQLNLFDHKTVIIIYL